MFIKYISFSLSCRSLIVYKNILIIRWRCFFESTKYCVGAREPHLLSRPGWWCNQFYIRVLFSFFAVIALGGLVKNTGLNRAFSSFIYYQLRLFSAKSPFECWDGFEFFFAYLKWCGAASMFRCWCRHIHRFEPANVDYTSVGQRMGSP